jgi:hypothetical protein
VAGDAAVAGARFLRSASGVLIEAGFAFAEATCKPHYAAKMGAPSVPPGRYFRTDSLLLREFCVCG